MTTLNQSQPPIQFWELHERDEIIRGQSVPHVPFWKAEKMFEVVYHFKGVHAHYIIASQDASITRSQALEWSKAHYAGRLATRLVDLSPCNNPSIK